MSAEPSTACLPTNALSCVAHRRAAWSRAFRVSALASALVAAAPGQAPPEHADLLARIARVGAEWEIPDGGHLGRIQAIRDARNDHAIAIVASHPDDPYVLPATILRLAAGDRVTIVLLTRGEGGQNNEGPEIGDDLATLRTLETADCARRLGLHVLHLNLPDAGFSRSAHEALDLWGRAEATASLARALRAIRPDVVMTTHHPAESHGHDLALLEILPDAIARAADPSFATPELGPIRIERVYRGAMSDEVPTFELPLDEDPERGVSYVTLAYAALTGAHRSQAPFRSVDELFAGAQRFVSLPLPGTTTAPTAWHDGLPDLFALLAGQLPDSTIATLRSEFDVTLPALVDDLPRLAAASHQLLGQLRAIPVASNRSLTERIERRCEALERILIHTLGVRIEVTCDRPVAVPGEALGCEFHVRAADRFRIGHLDVAAAEPRHPVRRVDAVPEPAGPGPWVIRATVTVGEDALGDDPLRDVYRRDHFGMPLRVIVSCTARLDEGQDVVLRVPVELPVAIRPPVEIAIQPRALVVPDGDVSMRFNVRLRRNTVRPLTDRLRVQLPPGFDIEPGTVDVDMQTEPTQGYLFRLQVPAGMRPGPQPIRVRIGNASARLELHRVPVSFPRDVRVGLVEGVDDASRTVLTQLGCELVVLTEELLPIRPLDDLDTILVDTRALGHHAAARAEFNRLIDFAARGGRLVVLYHKDAEFNPTATGQRYFPRELPFVVGKGRVTREDAPVEALLPSHALLNEPNRIRSEDWDGWVQERGLYFAATWAPEFQPILRLADPGEPPEDGALLFARTGRGEYVYCALALHRQLKNMHPGACRLFANLIAHRRTGR